MKIIFRKTDLPMLEKIAARTASSRDGWLLARRIRLEDGFQNSFSSAFLLLSNAAEQGDPWAMCELARLLYEEGGDAFLPVALSWWRQAAGFGDPGALRDLAQRGIPDRIASWGKGLDYCTRVYTQCAMLTEWTLTGLGRDDWNSLTMEEKRSRVQMLMGRVSPLLHIQPPALYTAPVLADYPRAHGLAHSREKKIGIVENAFEDYPRLIQILFHELGHFVVFSMWDGSSKAQMNRWGITQDRVNSWHRKDMGLSVPTGEEDPDSLSYGVYTQWMLHFGR